MQCNLLLLPFFSLASALKRWQRFLHFAHQVLPASSKRVRSYLCHAPRTVGTEKNLLRKAGEFLTILAASSGPERTRAHSPLPPQGLKPVFREPGWAVAGFREASICFALGEGAAGLKYFALSSFLAAVSRSSLGHQRRWWARHLLPPAGDRVRFQELHL